MANDQRKTFDDRIADSKDQEQVLRGILPKNMFAYRLFRFFRLAGLIFLGLAILMFILTFIEVFKVVTVYKIYRLAILGLAGIAIVCFLFMFLIRIIFLRKAPFDDWVFDISSKRLGTEVIFYDSRYIYIQYDRAGKEVDKREFVIEMSDKSINYSYFYIKTFIDKGVIQVECKKRQPIPKLAAFSEEDDLFWNIIPLGLAINTVTQKISPVGWYLNDQHKNPELVETIPSTSILISGGTGCHAVDEVIIMYDTMLKLEK